ncbi:MAG: tRNA lysidine(34) synthetase TilS [Ignavibacteriae bacterium]|nr:tRNA lysidine(34) synthetase TilS [Ignavibacteriota bacterium]MCB9217586.1 tRNA lysidine(34) synthetase TilS [Ignavibacteria bacterium]
MVRKSETIDPFVESVRRFMRLHEMSHGGESILVAVSGGIDSVVMLDVIARLSVPLRFSFGVAHFDHGLRESSTVDADFVRELATRYRVKAFVASGDVRRIADEEGRSVEETARRERYAFLERIARRHRYDTVMTGHTADDNAETLMMNLLRGSGVTGLAGIPPTRRLAGGGTVIVARPLLGQSRHQIEEYASASELKWREDESNQSGEFTRNRVRHELMALLRTFNPNVVETLNTTAGLMRDFDRYLSSAVEAALRGTTVEEPVHGERILLDVRQLRHLQPALRGEVVQRAMCETFDIPPISHVAVERGLNLIWKETGARASLGGRFEALRDRDTIVLLKNPPVVRDVDRLFDIGDSVEIAGLTLKTSFFDNGKPKFVSNGKVEYVDADRLPEKLTIRSWREGDRFHPLGMKGEKKLSDFLIDQKIPLDRKRQVMVITDGDKIIWVCGMRIDERFKVNPKTQRILKMELQTI